MLKSALQVTRVMVLAMLLGMAAPIQASDAQLISEQQDGALPEIGLVGIVETGGAFDQAIVKIEGREQVLYWLDAVDDYWWLESIGKDHILLTDGERFARVDLYHGRPTLVSNDSVDSLNLPEPATQPLATVPLPGPSIATPGSVHTAATHSDLEPGQRRKFHALPEESQEEFVEGSPMTQWQSTQDEFNDPGMSRRFASEPAPPQELTGETDEAIDVAQIAADAPLEPGQSRRFGPLPPPDEENTEE